MFVFVAIAAVLVVGPFTAVLVDKKLNRRRAEKERRHRVYKDRLVAVCAILQEPRATTDD